MSPELLWKLGRLGGAALSSDGSQVAYAVRSYALEENKGRSTLYLYDLATQKTRALLHDWAGIGDVQYAPAQGGERLFFSGRSGAGELATQAWTLDTQDGKLSQVTDVEDGIANLKVSPTGEHVAYTLDVKLDKEVSELYEDLPDADARIIDSLMYRHWSAWHDYKYSHLHVAPLGADGQAGEALGGPVERRLAVGLGLSFAKRHHLESHFLDDVEQLPPLGFGHDLAEDVLHHADGRGQTWRKVLRLAVLLAHRDPIAVQLWLADGTLE